MKKMSEKMLLAMYDALLKSRIVEGKLVELYTRGDIPFMVHSAIGQEAIPVGATFHLQKGDVFTTVRGHIESNIVMGMDLKRMFAEFYGKEAGYCRGKGGEIHLCAPDCGNKCCEWFRYGLRKRDKTTEHFPTMRPSQPRTSAVQFSVNAFNPKYSFLHRGSRY